MKECEKEIEIWVSALVGALVKLSPAEDFKIGKDKRDHMGESGNEKAISKTTRKHQVRTTTIKKGWVQALPIKVSSTFFWIFWLCHFTASAVYFDWPQFESENISLLRDLRLRSSYHGFNL